MRYVDGYVLPVPKKSMAIYRRIALKAGKIWREHGALEYRECVGDDLDVKGLTPFPRRIRLKRGETVVFSWIVFTSRAHRDRVNARVMNDKRLAGFHGPEDDAVRRQAHGLRRLQGPGRSLARCSPRLDCRRGEAQSLPRIALRARRTPMPTFMVQASYTNIAWNKLVQRPENRMEALKPVVEKLGGQVLAWYYTFGDYDVLVLFDVPSNVNAAAFSMAIAGSGAVKDFKTTILMTPDEGFDALLLAQGAGYRPPGG
jgi:uncharacterized protein YbaA (DUF1428 family)/uncharacterized protein with GYD domain